MRAVNLLPKDEARSSRGLPSPWIMLSATVPVIAGTLVYLGYSSEHSKVTERKSELAIVQAQIDKLSRAQAGLQAQSVLVGLRSTREAALQDALSKSVAWDVTLKDLARVLPPGVALTSLSAQSPTPAASGPMSTPLAATSSSAGIALQGTAQNHGQIAEVLERLSLLPMLTNVTLGTTSTTVNTSGPPQVTFQLSATIQPTQPAPPGGGS
jgi:Tfp pilus assembly protein PilN